jgi:nucleotide-binding universal stress UspA family protein
VTLHHIAVPIHNSDQTAAVLELADRIASRLGATLHLVSPSAEPMWATSVGGEYVFPPHFPERAVLADQAREALEHRLSERADELSARADATTRAGQPLPAMLGYLEDNPVDLIITPSRGIGMLSRLLHSSVAGELARESGIPVLVLGPEANAAELAADGIRSAVIAIEDSATALALARVVGQLIEAPARVELVHVAPAELETPPPGLLEIESLVANFFAPGVRVELIIERGPIAEAIRHRADEMGADLIAVGSRAHDGVADRIFGTTADAILASGGRAVLAVPRSEIHATAAAEEAIDATIDASFPASDPPAY